MNLAQGSVLSLSGTAKRLRAATVHTWMRNSRDPLSIATVVLPVPGEAYVLGMHGTLRSRSLSELHEQLLNHSRDFLG